MKSTFLNLNLRDLIKGFAVAIVTALLTGIYQVIQSGGVIDWTTIKPVVLAAIGAGLSYIIKNYLTNSKDEILTKE
jgi:branched-subunit amino acid transport protein